MSWVFKFQTNLTLISVNVLNKKENEFSRLNFSYIAIVDVLLIKNISNFHNYEAHFEFECVFDTFLHGSETVF